MDHEITFPPDAVTELCASPLKIAVVYSRPPVPMTRADQKTVAHLIEFLSKRGHEIDLHALDGGEAIPSRAMEWLQSRCSEVFLTRKARWRCLLDSALAIFSSNPLQTRYFWSGEQSRKLAKEIAQKQYDLVYVYYVRSADVFSNAVRGIPEARRPGSVLAMQLSQALNTRRMVEKMARIQDRLIYGVESRRLGRYEACVWKGFDRIILIGQKDHDEVNQLSREAGHGEVSNTFLCAHGVDTKEFAMTTEDDVDPKLLVFSGVMGTNTNIHAITWFVSEVWPQIRAQEPGTRLCVVGRKPSDEVLALGKLPGITVTGEVPSPADYIRRAAVCINPMQVGAGMQNKLLEFLSMGKATVATPLANEGIGAPPGAALLIAENAEDFARKTVSLLRDPEQRTRLGVAARRFVESNWTWEAQFLILEAEFLRMAQARGTVAQQSNAKVNSPMCEPTAAKAANV